MYQQVLVSMLIATSPLLAAEALTHTTATLDTMSSGTPRRAVPATQKPGTEAAKTASKGIRTVEIIGTDDLKFSVTEIEAKRGEQIRIRLTTKSAMPKVAMAHNFVLLRKGASQIKFVTASAQARENEFIAPEMKDQVLAFTPLAGGGETVETVFKVPAAAGKYPYLCSFPGHFQAGMRGTLTVK